ncbi:hypothetical protein Hanom_Chr12g01176841 [Helianthus anomalus]
MLYMFPLLVYLPYLNSHPIPWVHSPFNIHYCCNNTNTTTCIVLIINSSQGALIIFLAIFISLIKYIHTYIHISSSC